MDPSSHWIAMEQQYYAQTVRRQPVVLVRGEGSRVWDADGKEYLDLLAGWAVTIEARLAYLQVVRHADLSARAESQQVRTIETTPKRGDILDRNGNVLAYSVEADSIYAVPTDIGDPDAAAAVLCRALRDCSARERQALAERIRRGRAFAYVRRSNSPRWSA